MTLRNAITPMKHLMLGTFCAKTALRPRWPQMERFSCLFPVPRDPAVNPSNDVRFDPARGPQRFGKISDLDTIVHGP